MENKIINNIAKNNYRKFVRKIFSLLLILALIPSSYTILGKENDRIASAASKVKLSKTSITMLINHTYKLKLKNTKKKPKWSSSNKTKVTVLKSGELKALDTGSVKIAAKLGKKKYVCKVKVVTYDADLVMAAYGYKALKSILPKGSDLKISKTYSGTYFSNKEFICFDATFKNKSGEKKHAYINVYKELGEALSYHTVTTSFYTDNLIIKFDYNDLDSITKDRSKTISLSKVKKISKIIFSLETIKIKKGKDFDSVNSWLGL